MRGWRDVSAIKSTGYFPSIYMAVDNCVYLQFQRIQHPLLVSAGKTVK